MHTGQEEPPLYLPKWNLLNFKPENKVKPSEINRIFARQFGVSLYPTNQKKEAEKDEE